MLQADPVAREPQVLLNRFRLERLLGRGGAGEVHAAFDFVHERRVALKILRSDAADPDLEESLRSEFRVLRGLSHPGIVQVYDFGRAAGQPPFYTMELLDGVDLSSGRDGVDPHAFVEQVGRALDYLHANGLVHSDLKPSNVFRVGDRYKLTDFGLVQRARGSRREANYGTLAYMPPERLRAGAGKPDVREDLYALGAILFEMLCGRTPYAGRTPEATIERILAGDLEAELAGAPEGWTRLLRRLLAADPAARFPSAWDLLQAWTTQFDRPALVPQITAPPFVGRRRELAAIRSAVAESVRGHGTLFYISGGPGVGKSALLDAAAAQIASHGMFSARLEAPASPRPLALVEGLAALYRRWLPGLPPERRAAAQQLAEWPEAIQKAASDEALLNVHAHALEALGSIVESDPHVLILDDAHRLDHGSRALLRFLASGVRDLGLVVIVAGREATAGSDATHDDAEALGHDLAEARRDGAAVRLVSLRELGTDDVTALVRRRFEATEEIEPLAQRIFDLTLGHPFFVTEAIQHLILTGQLRRQAEGWVLQPQTERKLLPRMADTILSEHIAAAGKTDRSIYEVLALFPAGATPEILATVLDQPVATVRAALEHGVRIRLLSGGRDGYRFGHELIREACAARCPATTARRFHRSIADALAGTAAEAYHRLAAGERTAQSRACYLREAKSYEDRRDTWEALRLFDAALEIDSPEENGEDLTLRVAELRIQIGRAEEAAALLLQQLAIVRRPLMRGRCLHRLGKAYGSQGRNAEALFHLQAAGALLREHASAEEQRLFVADLVRILLTKGDSAAAIEACTGALAELPAGMEPLIRAKLLVLQAQAERQSGDYAAAEVTCRAALETLKPLGRTLDLGHTYTQIGTNYVYRRDYEQAERYHRAALKVFQELGDLHGMKGAYNNLGTALMRADKLEAAIQSYQMSLEIKRRLGDRPGEGSGLNNLGNLWERRGELRRAFQCYRRGVSIYRRLNRPRELTTLYYNMGEVQMRRGRLRNAARIFDRAQAHAAGIAGAYVAQFLKLSLGATQLMLLEPQACLATLNGALPAVERSALPGLLAQFHALLALAYGGVEDPSRAELHERLAQEALAKTVEDEERLDALLHLAASALQLGRGGDAERDANAALDLAERGARPFARAQALHLLAITSQRRGDWDLAESRLERAAQICRDLGFRHELSRCYKSLGTLHWDIGLRARAEEDFRHCVQLLEDLGLRSELGLTYLQLARLTQA